MGGFIFTYLALRVSIVPITTDEYLTLRYFVERDWGAVFTSYHPDPVHASNNHVLNSIFFKLSISIFGEHDWAIRLHVLAAFGICYHFLLKLFKQLEVPPLRSAMYLALVILNPYLLDFFGIARGYALSMAGWSAATYYFILYRNEASLRNLRNLLVWLFVAFYANFSAMYFALLFGLALLSYRYQNRKEPFVKKHLILIGFACVVAAAITYQPLYRTLHAESTHGGTTGFFTDAIVSYVLSSTHYNPHVRTTGVFAFGWHYREFYGVLLLVAWVIAVACGLKKDKSKLMNIAMQNLVYQCVGSMALCVVLFHSLQVPYPFTRTTLLFSLPFVVSFLVAMEILVRQHDRLKYFLLAATVAAAWHFMVCCNLDNTKEWEAEGDAKLVLRYLQAVRKDGRLIHIGVENFRYPSLAFYDRNKYKGIIDVEWLNPAMRPEFEYLYVPGDDIKNYGSIYKVEENFGHGVLLKRASL
ncbi:MAG: glycosyltransferase family 39 protein [Saprospiraceae bacterium]|nr:glycosyltransferase family 39 protein [Saprospiraceae bacterium]